MGGCKALERCFGINKTQQCLDRIVHGCPAWTFTVLHHTCKMEVEGHCSHTSPVKRADARGLTTIERTSQRIPRPQVGQRWSCFADTYRSQTKFEPEGEGEERRTSTFRACGAASPNHTDTMMRFRLHGWRRMSSDEKRRLLAGLLVEARPRLILVRMWFFILLSRFVPRREYVQSLFNICI